MTVLVAALAIATAVGLVLRRRDGRVRTTGDRGGATASADAATGGWALAGTAPSDGDRVLLLQLSSPVCTPCRRTAELIDDLRARQPGVAHTEVDVAERPEVARALGVLRTPTVVAFDRSGAEFVRVSGLPRAAELEAALAPVLDAR
ncbi:thioredoxin family protein [Pseudonocardia oceani]|uniref:thioredoxin family protein n=1 Tax=Pseudonocardia oceani TaxID=2792013 RepID=UPI0027E2B334|nr:thioredoxin family protein [Pseudonocardia oceani]